nr:hypothetical protein [Tanacetum cinerariifolium]
MPNVNLPQGMDTGGSPRRQETMGGRTEWNNLLNLTNTIPPIPHDSPLIGGYIPGSDEGRMIGEVDKDETINLVSKQGEVQETTKPLKDDDNDAILAETLLNIKRSTTKDKRKAQKLHAKELAKETARQEQEREAMKRSRFNLQQQSSKKQKLDKQIEEEVEAQADTNQEIEEMKLYVKLFPDEDIAIDAIPLATKPSVIMEYKIVKEGKISTYHIIRADESTKRYTSMIKLLENVDREDFRTLWKLFKDKHRNTRLEEDYERVLWGDIKVMLEPDIESEVWRQLQGYDVTAWKLFSLSEVHFVRFKNVYIFMLVDKNIPSYTYYNHQDARKKTTNLLVE